MDLKDDLKDLFVEFERFDKLKKDLELHVNKRVKEILGDYDSISVTVNPSFDEKTKFTVDIEFEDPYNVFDLNLSAEQDNQLRSIFGVPIPPYKLTNYDNRMDKNLKVNSLKLTFFIKSRWIKDNWGLD